MLRFDAKFFLRKRQGGLMRSVWPPLVTLHKSSLLSATKIVEFKGVTATVWSNLILVSFNRKPKYEDHTGLYLAAALTFIVALMPSPFWLPVLGRLGVVFLPVFQMAAVILGWNMDHFLPLAEWPSTGGNREVKLDSEDELKEFGSNLFKYISPWDRYTSQILKLVCRVQG